MVGWRVGADLPLSYPPPQNDMSANEAMTADTVEWKWSGGIKSDGPKSKAEVRSAPGAPPPTAPGGWGTDARSRLPPFLLLPPVPVLRRARRQLADGVLADALQQRPHHRGPCYR